MLTRRILALGSATVALLIAPAGALAAGTTVSVRVEGAKRTLLATTVVHTHAGSITKGGTPKGACPATSAAGALDVATRGHWGAHYDTSFGQPELISIFGERYPFSATATHFWDFWLNDKFARHGICQGALKKGDRILFAAAPTKGNVFPMAIRAPHTATTKRAFAIRIVYYTLAGKPRPLANARVSDGKHSVLTNATGYVTIHALNAGKYHFTASENGYIRPATATVKVS